MIQLTRLNNARLAVNCDLIKYVEEAPDTVITLLNGEKLVVRETTEQVIERVRDFRRSVLIADPDAALPSGMRANCGDARRALGQRRRTRRVDKSSFMGIIVGLGGIIAGLLLEGGKLAQVLQPTAAIIVFGGTLGAVLLQFPMPVVALGFPPAGAGLLRAQAGSATDRAATGHLRQQGAALRHRFARRRSASPAATPS